MSSFNLSLESYLEGETIRKADYNFHHSAILSLVGFGTETETLQVDYYSGCVAICHRVYGASVDGWLVLTSIIIFQVVMYIFFLLYFVSLNCLSSSCGQSEIGMDFRRTSSNFYYFISEASSCVS